MCQMLGYMNWTDSVTDPINLTGFQGSKKAIYRHIILLGAAIVDLTMIFFT